jgi:FMN-dependent NADH-azoreductase
VTYLLSIHVSPRGEASFSNQVLKEFELEFAKQHPELDIKSRFTGDIPHLDFGAQFALRVPIDQHDETMRQDFALANLLTDEIDGAAALVIATPMYNWGPPSSLKAWIDRIVNVRTWHQPTVDISNLPVTVIVTSAGLYSVGENVEHDHLRPLLRECFGRIRVQDLRFIDCDPTYPLERGQIDKMSSESAFATALAAIPSAAARAR